VSERVSADDGGLAALQIPYLLGIALSLSSYLPAFAPAPRQTFALLRKLDHAFASLLEGRDVGTGERLPGIEEGGGGGMSRTDMVRCKSLVEQTRVVVVEVMGGGGGDEEEEDEGEEERGGGDKDGDDVDMGEEGEGRREEDDDDQESVHSMDVARVYEKTIVRIDEMLNRGTAYDVGGSG